MAFTWTPITSLETQAVAGHMNEVQTNINTLTDGLGVSRYTWTQLPVISLTSQIRAPQITELQQAVNYADSQNICVTKNVTQNIGILVSNDVSVDGVRYTGVDNSQNLSVYSGRDITYNSGVDITADNPRYSTNYPGRDVTVYGTRCSPADASAWSAADGALNGYALRTNWGKAQWATYNSG